MCKPESLVEINNKDDNVKCKIYKPYSYLSKNTRLLLDYHNKLDHLYIFQLKGLSKKISYQK